MRDATAVARLRAAGAVIIGKTVTTEFAYFHPGRDAQSARSRAHARRFVVGLGGGGRGRHGAAGDRLADQRLDDPAGVLLRRLRRQADARPDFARRRFDVVAARSTTSAHSRARLPTPALILEALAGYDADDPDTRPVAAPDFLETLARRAADAAAICFRAHAGLGQGRPRTRARHSRRWPSAWAIRQNRSTCRSRIAKAWDDQRVIMAVPRWRITWAM